MPNFSSVTIIGHMVRDVEVRQAGEHDVGSFSVAVTKKRGGKETVSYFDCKAWNKNCEFTKKYFKKGDAILVQGELEQETWDDKETGNKRSKVVITVDKVAFVGGQRRENRQQEGEGQTQQPRSYYSGRGTGSRDTRNRYQQQDDGGSDQAVGAESEIPF